MGKTIAEKILGAHAHKEVRANDIALCDVDFAFSQDGTSTLVIGAFDKIEAKERAAFKKFAMVIDHSVPSPHKDISNIHQKMREFCAAHGITLYDYGRGVCHQVIPESGRVVPGNLVVGADSHTCTYGALNACATGMGSTDVAVILATGKNWFRVPETVKIILNGRLPRGTSSKDVILYLAGQLKSDGCTYMAIEFAGPVIERLSVDARMTISNMAIEVGAKAGLMDFDKKLEAFYKDKGVVRACYNPACADKDALYKAVKEFDLSTLAPQVARPHAVDNVCAIQEAEGTPVQECFIGTCTNGRLEDLSLAAGILKNRKIHPDTKLIVAPASDAIYREALRKGYIQTLVHAGGLIIPPGCGPCVGTHAGIPPDRMNVISTANRNFKGRMGNPNAFIYLASPLTVAASAVHAKITDPRKYL